MSLRERHDLVLGAVRAARAAPRRRLVAGALLFTALLLYLLLLLFPGLPSGVDPRSAASALAGRPGLFAVWIAGAATLVWAVWTLVGGAVVRGVALEIAHLPPDGALLDCRHRWLRLFLGPFASLLPGALLLGLAAGMASVVRIPLAGWPLLLLLAPAVLLLASGAARILLGWLLCGHLVLPGTAIEGGTAFGSTSRAAAWLRARPLEVVLLRVGGGLLALFESAVVLARPAAGVAGVVLLLRAGGADPFGPALRTLGEGFGTAGPAADLAGAFLALLLLLAGAWYAAVPVCHGIGARAGLYLLHRRERDAVPVDAPPPEAGAAPGLEALGIELVARLRDERGE